MIIVSVFVIFRQPSWALLPLLTKVGLEPFITKMDHLFGQMGRCIYSCCHWTLVLSVVGSQLATGLPASAPWD